MKTTGLVLGIGCVAAALLSGAGGCGGITASPGIGDGGTDGPASSGSGGSGSGGSGSGSTSGASSSGSGGGSSSGSGGSTSGSGGGSGSGGSSSSSGVSSSSGSGGSSSGSGSGSGGSSSSSGGPSGTIYFQQCTGSALCATSQFSFFAGFYPTTTSQGCTITQSGSCASYSCSGSSTAPQGVSAGTLTISGGSLGTVTVTPDSTNAYSYQVNGAKYAAGQTLTVSASGATVPAFGPESVVAPGLPTLLFPVPSGTTYTIPTTTDLTVAWSGGVAGAVIIFEGTSSSSESYFTCEWQASLGKAAVPQSVLAPLAGQTGGYLIYGQYAATTFNAGGYTVSEAALPFSGAMANFK